MKKLVLVLIAALIAIGSVASAAPPTPTGDPVFWADATQRGYVFTKTYRYNLFYGPTGSVSPFWFGAPPSGTSHDSWLYFTGEPTGIDYLIYSAVAKPSVFSGDITVNTESTGGNAYARNQISGLLKLNLVSLGTGTNGTTETTSYLDDSPTGEWTAVDASVTLSADTSIYRVGSTSLKMAFAAGAAADDGATIDIVNDDLSSNESVGFWVYTDVAAAAGDLQLLIDDTSNDTKLDLPALTANAWQWVEIDVSSLDGTTGNIVDKVGVVLSTAGATNLAAFNLYLDSMYKWDSTDEETFGDNISYDGVLSVITVATAAGSANTSGNTVAYTDYFVNYQSGNEVLVWVTDQSANSAIALYNY